MLKINKQNSVEVQEKQKTRGAGKPMYMHTTKYFSTFDLNIAVEFELTYRSNSFGKILPER